jgi:hypothetical protein
MSGRFLCRTTCLIAKDPNQCPDRIADTKILHGIQLFCRNDDIFRRNSKACLGVVCTKSLEKVSDSKVKGLRQYVKATGTDPVCAIFVFLHLLV